MARLKKMFEDSNLAGELQGTSIKQDLDELYGDEMADSENYGRGLEASQEDI